MRVVYDPSVLQPTATASSSNGANSPLQAIDGQTGTFWESNAADSDAVGPWLQVDLTRILKVYQIQITFDTVEVPSQMIILASDLPTDSSYGTYSNASTSAFDLMATFIPTNGGTNTINITPAQSSRYWRFQSTAIGQIRIKEIAIFAASNAQNTSSRIRVNGIMFSDQGNDLLSVDVQEQGSKGCGYVRFRLNNKGQKYTSSQFPSGSTVKCWVDGVLKLYGILIECIPSFIPTRGVEMEMTAHDWGDFLVNNILYQAWAGVPVFDSTKAADIIGTGPNSILGMTTNSAGATLINSNGVQATTGGLNTIFYLKAKNESAWSALQRLQQRAVSGAWIPQNTGFDQGTVSSVTLGVGGADTDGYWTSQKTYINYAVTVRDNSQGNPTPSGKIDTTAVIDSTGAVLTTASNKNGKINSTDTYNGNVANDGTYLYGEIFQPVFVNVSDLNQAGSFSFYEAESGQILTTTGGLGFTNYNDIVDIIVETSPSPGVTRRLHYLLNTHVGSLAGTFPPTDTANDAYLSIAGAQTTTARNLFTDYSSKFGTGSANNDVVLMLRVRVIPFQQQPNSSQTNQGTTRVYIDNLSLSPISGVKIPPVQYDFNVGVDSSGNPTLNWFPQPRPGVDINYRHLDPSNNLRWYTTFPQSDLNNIEEFHFTKSDIYRTKTDVTVRGKQARAPSDRLTVDASVVTTDVNYLLGQTPPHGDAFPSFSIRSSADMAQFGRRITQKELSQTNVSDLARDAIASWNQTRGVEQRASVLCKGNANLTPGQVIYVDSDYSDIKGYYYIITAEHRWDDMGYKTLLMLQDDRFRVANEFARLQANISQILNLSPTIKNKSFTKSGANLGGVVIPPSIGGGASLNKMETSHTWLYQSMDADQVRLPFNFVPELAAITKVRIVTTRLSATEGYGTSPPSGFTINATGIGDGVNFPTPGWDTVNAPALAGTNTEYEINQSNWFGQRFQVGTTSAGKIMFGFRIRRPNDGGQASTLFKVSVYNDISPSNVGGSPGSSQSWIPGLTNFVYDQLAQQGAGLSGQQGQWKTYGYNNLTANGTGNVTSPPAITNQWFFFEADLGKPFIPNQSFWVIMRMEGPGSAFIYTGQDKASPVASDYWATSSDAGKTWTLSSAGTGIGRSLYISFNSLSLTSAAEAASFQQGNPCGLTVWDPYTGNGIGATAIVPGTSQIASSVEFATFVIARKNANGQVDVAFPASAGGLPLSGGLITFPTGSAATAGYRAYGRWDYIANVTYLE